MIASGAGCPGTVQPAPHQRWRPGLLTGAVRSPALRLKALRPAIERGPTRAHALRRVPSHQAVRERKSTSARPRRAGSRLRCVKAAPGRKTLPLMARQARNLHRGGVSQLQLRRPDPDSRDRLTSSEPAPDAEQRAFTAELSISPARAFPPAKRSTQSPFAAQRSFHFGKTNYSTAFPPAVIRARPSFYRRRVSWACSCAPAQRRILAGSATECLERSSATALER
jgi:hypothetical protein